MTNQIKCPNCGNGNVQTLETWSPKNECLKCYECGCNNWDESKRQPPEITPEMVWEMFVTNLLNFDPEITRVYIDHGREHANVYLEVDEGSDTTRLILVGAELKAGDTCRKEGANDE